MKPTALTYSDAWIELHSAPISIRLARAEFLSNPPALQEERLVKIQRLIRLHPRSYLAAHAREIYGI